MRPEDRQISKGDPRGHIQPPSRSHVNAHKATADLTRAQLDSIYNEQHGTGKTESNDKLQSAYKRTHQSAHQSDSKQWQQYHSAWQDYYQKYYEQYYVGAVNQVHQAYTDHLESLPKSQLTESTAPASVSQDQAVSDIRSQLRDKVRNAGSAARKSRHFVPISAAVVVLLLFSFLQYNQVIMANVKAYVTPGEINPQDIVVDPNADVAVTDEPLLIIPKINVNVPVDYDTTPDQASQQEAMKSGVAYFGIPGANSKPGQIGNTVISGHSSNDILESGNQKFVFALLERLKKGDTFYLHYEGVRYTYSITGTKVVKPNDVGALVYDTDKPEVTLITCTPLGTALNRLLVTAEQVSPNPAEATNAPSEESSDDKAVMPGNSPTFFERLFN